MPVLVWVIGESPNSKQWKKLFSYYCLFIYYCSNKHFSGILFLYKELPSTPLLQTSQNIIVLLCLKEMFSFYFQRKSDYIFFLFQIFMGKSINHFWQLTIFIYFDASVGLYSSVVSVYGAYTLLHLISRRMSTTCRISNHPTFVDCLYLPEQPYNPIPHVLRLLRVSQSLMYNGILNFCVRILFWRRAGFGVNKKKEESLN